MLTSCRFHLLKRTVLFLVVFSVAPSVAAAQTPGDATFKPITTFATDAAAQARPRLGLASDSLINGALIGAGVAVASGLFVCTRMEPWRVCRDDVGPMLKLGAIGAGIGAGIDALLMRRHVTSDDNPNGTTLHAAPIISRDAKGVRLSVGF
jgi:hypothetical protein